jgi:hypothetical protein
MLLVLSSTQTSRVAVASLAGRVVLGVTLIAYTTHASRLGARPRRSEPGHHLDGGDDNRQTTAGSPGSRTGPLGQA